MCLNLKQGSFAVKGSKTFQKGLTENLFTVTNFLGKRWCCTYDSSELVSLICQTREHFHSRAFFIVLNKPKIWAIYFR